MADSSETLLCSRCGKNPRANPDSENPWCKECKSKYQKEYNETKAKQDAAHHFALGVNAMRERVAAIFERCGSAVFSANEVTAIIRKEPRPTMPE